MPLIAMTREMGSLGKDVAAGIAARSGTLVVYHEIIEPIANKMRLRKSHVERFLRDGSTGVIRGWGAVHLLRDIPHVIRVRVCAPMETLVKRMMERLATDDRANV